MATPSPPPTDDYDPHAHREVNKPTSNLETLIHLVKCCLGTGILALPQSFTRAGLIPGIVGTAIVGAIITHCLQILIKMQYKVCKMKRVPQLTYPQCLEIAMMSGPKSLQVLAKPFAATVDVLNITYQLGICCVYIVFLAENLKKLVDPFLMMPLLIHTVSMTLPLIGLNLIPNLKALAPLSLFANFITGVGLGAVYYVLLTGRKAAKDDPIDYWGTLLEIPLFFGTMLFALTSVPVVVALERAMKTPKSYTQFFGVLNAGMTFIVVLYGATGALGYLYCRSGCSDSITLDMPQGTSALIVQMTMVIAVLISYALHCYVPVDVIYSCYIIPRLEKNNATPRKKKVVEYILRVGLCLFTAVIAMLVPRLGLFISLFGALCLSTLGLCYPALMEICLSYPDNYGPAKIYLMKDIILFIIGIMGLCLGTYTALAAIVTSFL